MDAGTHCAAHRWRIPGKARETVALYPSASVPDYLSTHYWWAYIHPKAVKLFERQWLVNLILCGNYVRLRDAALAAMGESLPGRPCKWLAFTAI